jgi:glycosyltransferase involved in cell wall biosynthesis
MAAADLVVLPSLYEGLPNVVLEAMRSRKPVVATAAPGTTEVVADGVTGLLVPERDPAALAAALARVLDHPELAGTLTKAARSLIEAEFNARHQARAVAESFHLPATGDEESEEA